MGHVAYMREMRNAHRIWMEHLKGRDHLDLGKMGG